MRFASESLPGPRDILRSVLPNGIVVLIHENPHAQSVVITGTLEAGSLLEPPSLNGLSSLVAALLLRGTNRRSFSEIHELLESSGASLTFSSGQHSVGFGGKGLAEDLPLLVGLLGEALREPIFPEDHVERVRGQMITGLKLQAQSTAYVASHLFRRLVYPLPHPYHFQSAGEIDTLAAIDREQIVTFHRQAYGPQGMVMVIVGAIDADAALESVREVLGDWTNPLQVLPPALPALAALETERQASEVMGGKSQIDLVLGRAGPSRFADDWHAANLANNIFGVFGMYGRIGKVVREQQGMAYYCYSRLDGGIGPGAWRVMAGVNPSNVSHVVAAIRAEIRLMTTELVTQQELEDNQANFIGRLPLQLESNEGVAGVLLSIERYQLGLDYVLRYADLIRSVSREDVLRAAQRYFDPDAYVLALAGPPVDGFGEG